MMRGEGVGNASTYRRQAQDTKYDTNQPTMLMLQMQHDHVEQETRTSCTDLDDVAAWSACFDAAGYSTKSCCDLASFW